MAAATMFSFAIGVLAPVLLEELGLSRLQVGTIVATYYLVGTVLSPASGSGHLVKEITLPLRQPNVTPCPSARTTRL
ncbi:MAG: hypothetical protein GEU78_13405 [Actinobacteria bacterium]|nr:hypothetical protein [Actinomycetota bacterium]